MLAQYAETETPASRVIYINSKDATITFNNNQSDFDFTLEEPIVVPDHHSILMSVYSAEIPYSFYNFQDGINTRIDYASTIHGTPADYDANGNLTNYQTLTIPQGNYTTTQLASYLENNLVIAGPIYPLKVRYDPIAMKFKFTCKTAGIRITLGLSHGVATGTATSPGDDMNEELGFDFINILGDPFVELNGAGNQWNYGFTNPTLGGGGAVVPGAGTDVGVAGPFFIETPLFADDVADVANSIRSLFIRTNLSTTSILDSHIGGGFSNILCRVPINTEPGGIINIRPADGDVHKLLLKLKTITNISIRLTNQKNTTINLNGLTFDISLKLDFMENKDLKIPKTLRQQLAEFRQEQEEKLKLKEIEKTKKK
tara:strand:+ start:344 stop:1456 length:1113 start_codon:yes stop_codon:yes gene_type:complete